MTPSLTKIGSFASEIGAEITAYDSDRQLLYVVSGGTTLQVIELSDPTSPQEVASLDIAQFGASINGANSIAYKNNLLAVAIAADPITDPGVVALIDLAAVTEINAAGGNILDAVKIFTVGSLPDMLTFSPDGSKVLVANEAEAVVAVGDDGAVTVTDPEGSVSIIDVSGDFNALSQSNVATADFSRFNGKEADLRGEGVRIFPDATTAQDVEPEYIAVSPDGTKAFVTLQENNAIAIVDIATATIEAIQPLGLKDYSLSGLDASDKDDAINIQPRPVFGLYMPDAVTSFESNGETFYLIANEGDDRGDADADPRGDAIRLKDLADVTSFGRSGLSLDPAFEQQLLVEGLLEDEALGRLTISSLDGDTDGDGDIDRLVAYGGRSFSVLDSSGSIIFDSGDQIERITAELVPELFNANDGDPEEVDTRSDNKGPEPETVTTGVIDGKLYAFVGLERAGGGVLLYDLTNPRQPEFVQYVRDNADIAPEGLTFVTADNSPNDQPLLIVANEVSNTVAIYQANTMDPTDPTNPVEGKELLGTAIDDHLIGTEGDDIIAGLGGADVIKGTGGDDVLRGDGNSRAANAGGSASGDDVIFGGAGNDRIGGKLGNDTLYGDAGNDTLYGDAGDDLLYGGMGNDTLYGDDNHSSGKDTFVLALGEGTDLIMDFQLGKDMIGLVGNLSFGQLSLTQRGRSVAIASGSEILAEVMNIDASDLDESAFMTVLS